MEDRDQFLLPGREAQRREPLEVLLGRALQVPLGAGGFPRLDKAQADNW
jgi:hypothetical protein